MSDSMILTVITLEVVVLMFERYPEPILASRVCDAVFVTFNGVFALEFVSTRGCGGCTRR